MFQKIFFLDHLHVLTQEALDHADLSVLTGTIGAAALLKNCLWCYIYSIKSSTSNLVTPLQKSYKLYHEMTEALAERLLDLHCRLLSLYILQDADSLDWDSPKPFCELERGSYVVQMWWLYMQGKFITCLCKMIYVMCFLKLQAQKKTYGIQSHQKCPKEFFQEC